MHLTFKPGIMNRKYDFVQFNRTVSPQAFAICRVSNGFEKHLEKSRVKDFLTKIEVVIDYI